MGKNILQYIQEASMDELAIFFAEIFSEKITPWEKWFNKNYCQVCEFYKKCKNQCGFADISEEELIKFWFIQILNKDGGDK